MKSYIFLLIWVFCLTMLMSCQDAGSDKTGSEYMPDMAHSIAYEANYYNYYYNNTWGSQDDYYKYAQPRKPVEGTVPRGYAGVFFAEDAEGQNESMGRTKGLSSVAGKSITPNGSVPYYYDDTEEERNRAIAELVDNPYPITDRGLATGKELYTIYCGICHGDKGDGLGYLAREDSEGGKYPAQPTNFLLDEQVNASNGRYFHAIMYGKNLMGSYADKLSYEERWQVIHYIRSLQAKDKKLAYNQLENTLNSVDIPAGEELADVEEIPAEDASSHDDDHHETGDH